MGGTGEKGGPTPALVGHPCPRRTQPDPHGPTPTLPTKGGGWLDSEEPGSSGFPRRAGRAGEEEGRGGVVAGWERKGIVRKGEYRDGGWWLGDDGFGDGGFGMVAWRMVGCECCIGNGRWNLNNNVSSI